MYETGQVGSEECWSAVRSPLLLRRNVEFAPFIEILPSWSSQSLLICSACTGLPYWVAALLNHPRAHCVLIREAILALITAKKSRSYIYALWRSFPMFLYLYLTSLICGFLLLFWHVADPGKSVMSARFRLPAGRSYNVRATELERDRQHTQVVCNVLLLDNTVQAFKVSVSTLI